ncbi:hypothetical protein [Herbiconiux liukaitaii]|uniref:hypothetical protein n=1 Tax=Herbiconiux liukaitaii TaxID=3342799 RepID=UPI0035BAA8C1
MVTPSGAYWVRVRLDRGVVEYLIGSELVDIEQVADVTAVIRLDDGREWQLRVMTSDALLAEVDRWRRSAGPHDLMSYTDLFVVSANGLETMSGAIATALADL